MKNIYYILFAVLLIALIDIVSIFEASALVFINKWIVSFGFIVRWLLYSSIIIIGFFMWKFLWMLLCLPISLSCTFCGTFLNNTIGCVGMAIPKISSALVALNYLCLVIYSISHLSGILYIILVIMLGFFHSYPVAMLFLTGKNIFNKYN